jgi:hypothetical protein
MDGQLHKSTELDQSGGIKMTNQTADVSQIRAAQVAGIMFLFALIIPSLNWALILSKFIVADNVIATATNILANEFQFRAGLTIELFMSICLIVLAMALYVVLKPINKNLARFALFLKLMEAAIVAAIVLVSFIALQVSLGNGYSAGSTPDHMLVTVGVSLNAHTEIYAIPMVILGLDMIVFSYLFLKSNYIPRALAGFGILSFALILIHALMFILAPDYAAMPINQIIFWIPSGLFEIVIGVWLLSKGLSVQVQEESDPESE